MRCDNHVEAAHGAPRHRRHPNGCDWLAEFDSRAEKPASRYRPSSHRNLESFPNLRGFERLLANDQRHAFTEWMLDNFARHARVDEGTKSWCSKPAARSRSNRLTELLGRPRERNAVVSIQAAFCHAPHMRAAGLHAWLITRAVASHVRSE